MKENGDLLEALNWCTADATDAPVAISMIIGQN